MVASTSAQLESQIKLHGARSQLKLEQTCLGQSLSKAPTSEFRKTHNLFFSKAVGDPSIAHFSLFVNLSAVPRNEAHCEIEAGRPGDPIEILNTPSITTVLSRYILLLRAAYIEVLPSLMEAHPEKLTWEMLLGALDDRISFLASMMEGIVEDEKYLKAHDTQRFLISKAANEKEGSTRVEL